MAQEPFRPGEFAVAPTLHRCRVVRSMEDSMTRRARLRIDKVAGSFPIRGPKPVFAYVHLLHAPREGQPVVWASRGTNWLALFSDDMRTGGIAFVVTGFAYANASGGPPDVA